MENNTPFCKSLNNALSFRIPGESNTLTFNPCCLYNSYIPFHPTVFAKQRKRFSEATDFLPECSKCELKEQTHGVNASLRGVVNKEIPDNLGDTIYRLEIAVDTTCNAACIQCGDLQSSLWRKETALDKKIYHIQPESQIDGKIDAIKKAVDLSKVKILHFWGGEPLLTDTHLKFLRDIEDLSDVTLIYTSNASIFPDDEVLRLWEKCKQVRVGLSIDGVGDKFHYIRWPLTWEKVKRNMELFRTESPSSVTLNINNCVLPLNIPHINELGEWLDKNFASVNSKPIGYHFIRGEGVLDIANTPLSLREDVWRTLPENHIVSNILREVPVLDPSSMIDYLDKWDKVRKLNWREIFCSSAKHFK